jgi:uncharacterized protein YqhQ
MKLESLFVLARVKNPDAWMLGTIVVILLLAVGIAILAFRARDRHYANDPALAKHAKRDASKALQIVVFTIVVGILAYVLAGIFLDVGSQ